MVMSLESSVNFSRSCDTVTVNAQGGAMHSTQPVAVGTPVLLRLQNGKEATGRVAFCKASTSNDKTWGVGVKLDKPGNFWGLNPCPEDWLVGNEDTAVAPDHRGRGVGGYESAGNASTANSPAPALQEEIENVILRLEPHQSKRAETGDLKDLKHELRSCLRHLQQFAQHEAIHARQELLRQLRNELGPLVSREIHSSQQPNSDLLEKVRALDQRSTELERQIDTSAESILEEARRDLRGVLADSLEPIHKQLNDLSRKLGSAEPAGSDLASQREGLRQLVSAQGDALRIELQKQVQKEMGTVVAAIQATFAEKLEAQRKHSASAEALIQDAVAARQWVTDTLQSLPETVDRTITARVEDALQQIEVRTLDTITRQAQSESANLQQQLRGTADELDRQVHQTVAAELEKAQRQLGEVAITHTEDSRRARDSFSDEVHARASEALQKLECHGAEIRSDTGEFLGSQQQAFQGYLDEQRQKITEIVASVGQVTDEMYSTLQQRLEKDFEAKQKIIESGQHAITTEAARAQAQLESVDRRIAKLGENFIQLEGNFSDRLDQILSETTARARTRLEQVLGELQNEQVGRARAAMESTLSPVSTRAESLITDLRSFVDTLSRDRDETQAQIGAAREEREEMQRWLARQEQEFRKLIAEALLDATNGAKASVQKALDTFQDPIHKFSCEAKKRIEEVTTHQHAELNGAMRRLRDELVVLQQQTEDSLRASSGIIEQETASQTPIAPNPGEHVLANTEESAHSQATLVQKLSRLLRSRVTGKNPVN